MDFTLINLLHAIITQYHSSLLKFRTITGNIERNILSERVLTSFKIRSYIQKQAIFTPKNGVERHLILQSF